MDRASSDLYIVHNLTRGVPLARRVSLAGSSAARRRGLTGVERMEPGSGLWIAPCEAVHTFGMKIALDVLFLDKLYRILKIASHLPPRRFSICLRASAVLELPAGAAAGVCLGDVLSVQPAETVEKFIPSR
jgi:uncharacterized membrane protein (UPF0127 family)